MIFKFNKQELIFEKKKYSPLVMCLTLYAFCSTGLTILGFTTGTNTDSSYELQTVNTTQNDTFSKEALVDMLKDMNLKYPHIVLAQAVVESNFKSPLFIDNNNMFGMRKAYQRPNVQSGINRDYAVYENWRMSVIDYALYQCYSLKDIHSE
jgi:hypothetical protein